MLQAIANKVIKTKPVQALIKASKQVILPGSAGKSLFFIARFFLQGIRQGSIITRASAISFQLFLAIFPAIIMLLTLIPYIPIDDFQERLMEVLASVMPRTAYELAESTMNDLVNNKYGTLLSFSFIIGIWMASNSVNAILQGLRGSYNLLVKEKHFKLRLHSLAIMFGAVILVGLAMTIITFSGTLFDYIQEYNIIRDELMILGLKLVKWFITAFLIMTMVSLLYNAADAQKKGWTLTSPGAIFSTFLIILVSLIFAWFVNNFGQWNKLYGSLGALLVLLLWIYFNMIVILIGFEMNTAISKAHIEK